MSVKDVHVNGFAKQSDLDQEISDRQSADQNLQDQIDLIGTPITLTQSVTNGNITQAPSSDAVFHAIKIVQDDVDTHEARTDNPHSVTKAQVGLGNVDNTSDVNKPVSTAQAASDAAVLSAAQTYADSVATNLWKDQGNYDASSNLYPTAANTSPVVATIKRGFIWRVSVAGTLPSGNPVNVGDTIRALVDNPGTTVGNWAEGEGNIGYVPENAATKNASGGYSGLSGFKVIIKNALGTISSLLGNSATAVRNWTLQDRDGILADDTDLALKMTKSANLSDVASTGTSRFNLNVPVLFRVRAVAKTAVGTLSGTTTQDGVSLSANELVLLTAESPASKNGAWIVQTGAWTRPSDFPSAGSTMAKSVLVSGGNEYSGTVWVMTNTAAVVIDTDSQTWSLAGHSFTLTFTPAPFNPSNNTSYYFSYGLLGPTTAATSHAVVSGKSFIVTGATVSASSNTTAGTAESSTLKIRNITLGTSSTIGSFITNGSSSLTKNTTITGVSIPIDINQSYCIEILTATFVTAPVNVRVVVNLICKLV